MKKYNCLHEPQAEAKKKIILNVNVDSQMLFYIKEGGALSAEIGPLENIKFLPTKL